MRRVLLTTDAAGGVWTYTLDLADGLRAKGLDVTLAVLGPEATPEQRRQARGLTLLHTGLPLDWTAQSAAELADAARALRGIAAAARADVVQLHSPALFGAPGWPAPVLAVLHSCVGTWWQAVRGDSPPHDFLWRMQAVRQGLLHADAAVAPSAAIAMAAREVYGLSRPIEVVHNARAPAPASGTFHRHGVLAAGRIWDEGKNFRLLEQVARLAPALPIAAAGPCAAPHGERLALQAVSWLGNLAPSALRRAMDGARIFAAPALYEPFGLAVLEAALAGLPLVLADIPSFRELWGDSALFLPPDRPELWAETLLRLHANPALCARHGEAACRHAGRYGPQRFISSMLLHYRQLAAERACA